MSGATLRKDNRFFHLLEHCHLSLYEKPNLSNSFRLLYCLDGSYLVLPHTVTLTIKSMYWTSEISEVFCTFACDVDSVFKERPSALQLVDPQFCQ